MVKLKMPQDGEERWEYPENFFKSSLKGEWRIIMKTIEG